MKYQEFLQNKLHQGSDQGFAPTFMPDILFDFQQHLAEWAIVKGRSGVFADCGLGKTPIQLTWAENVAIHTDKPTLILTPLAVAAQTMEEGEKFGVEVIRSSDGQGRGRVTVTNYEQLHHFQASDFGGVVCDESSILKNFDGARRGFITEFMKRVPYRLLTTATAAPNDYIELGTSSEALGFLGHMDMLNRFFKNDQNNSATRRMYGEAPKWRFKGHAELPFWRWVTSWAIACRKPSDIGYEDGKFVLPPLIETQHLVDTDKCPEWTLFSVAAANLYEQREERKRTIEERCQAVASLVNGTGEPALVWCHLNDEGDLLERLIPDAVQVSGQQSDKAKEDRFLDFKHGNSRVLICKPKIGAWGLNFDHCRHVTFFPSHSYEQYYQSIRRCWRFPQDKPVRVDLVMTEGDGKVMDNMTAKAKKADRMFENLVAEMNNASGIEKINKFKEKEELPSWL